MHFPTDINVFHKIHNIPRLNIDSIFNGELRDFVRDSVIVEIIGTGRTCKLRTDNPGPSSHEAQTQTVVHQVMESKALTFISALKAGQMNGPHTTKRKKNNSEHFLSTSNTLAMSF